MNVGMGQALPFVVVYEGGRLVVFRLGSVLMSTLLG